MYAHTYVSVQSAQHRININTATAHAYICLVVHMCEYTHILQLQSIAITPQREGKYDPFAASQSGARGDAYLRDRWCSCLGPACTINKATKAHHVLDLSLLVLTPSVEKTRADAG
jgi:hypothetical protein